MTSRLAVATASTLMAMLAAGACSTAGGVRSTPPAAPDAPNPLAEFTGIWKGTSTSSFDAAKVRISFDMQRDGEKLKGTYRCAPFNATCRNNVQRGWVKGQTTARGFTVSMEDTSWCTFLMDEFYPPVADGEYTCYMGGSVVDQGTFELKGSPASPPTGASPEKRS
ncbi:MAG TPA: hypothetical protein VFB33_17835 [Candidatus Binataceae bacterium]|nr:hypothetical protein [Candidatus Binataceae bacterium]